LQIIRNRQCRWPIAIYLYTHKLDEIPKQYNVTNSKGTEEILILFYNIGSN